VELVPFPIFCALDAPLRRHSSHGVAEVCVCAGGIKIKIKINVKSIGQECPIHTGRLQEAAIFLGHLCGTSGTRALPGLSALDAALKAPLCTGAQALCLRRARSKSRATSKAADRSVRSTRAECRYPSTAHADS
jgi:hypothetical protein